MENESGKQGNCANSGSDTILNLETSVSDEMLD